MNHYTREIVVRQYQSELRAAAAEQRLGARARSAPTPQRPGRSLRPTLQHRLITAVTGALR